jgi:hypothetical protein
MGARFAPVLLLGLALAAAPPARAAAPAEADGVSDWLGRMGERFEANPQWKSLKGTGWKPYNRLKWFFEQRMVQGQDPPPGARFLAWEELRRREGIRVLPYNTSWFSVGPANFAGRMLALAFDPSDPDVVYAGAASGGLWKSFDRGVTWTPITDEEPVLAVGGVAVLPSDPNVVIMGTGEATLNIDRVGGVGILKSTDAGATWNPTSLSYSVIQGHGFHFVAANPIRGTLLAGATNGLWRSSDAGDTWTRVDPGLTGGDYYAAQWKPGHADSVFAAKGSSSSGNNVKVSTDDGLTWTVSGTGQPSSGSNGKTRIATTPADPDVIYAIYVDRFADGVRGVYRSTDAGASWALRSSPQIVGGQGWYNLTLVADPNDADRVLAGGVTLHRSTDGGLAFTQVGFNVHVDHHDAVYVPGSTSELLVATDGGVWSSTNDGSSWLDRNAGLVTYQFYDICVNNHGDVPDFIMGGTQDQGTDRWTGTTSWGEGLGGDGMVCNISPHNGDTVYAEQQFGQHRKSTNSGVNWAPIMTGITGQGAWVTPVDQDVTQRRRLYTSTNDGIFRTTDAGASWENVAPHTATWISFSPLDSGRVWTAGAATWVTTDDGANWTQAAPFPAITGAVTKILAHPTDATAALVTFSGYQPGLPHVMRTTDLGASWQDVTGDLPDQPVNAIAVDPANPSHWFAGTDVGVWVTVDGGSVWAPFHTGLPNVVVVDLEIQAATRKLFAGTHGRGAWEIDITSIMSLDPEDEGEPGPDVEVSARNLMLDPPWPNPIREEAMLRFAARYEGDVVLEIFDLAGRRVAEVARLDRGDGIVRHATWQVDGAANGVYFAVLRAGEHRTTRKLVVAK